MRVLFLALTSIGLAAAQPSQPARGWDQYQVLMWSTGTPADRAAWIARLKELGFTGEQCMGCDVAPYVKARFGFYVENMVQELAFLHGRAALYKTDWDNYTKPPHDKRFLIRKPSLNDPAFWQAVKPSVQAQAKRYAGHAPLLYQLRDELSIGSFASPMDYDFSPVALGELRVWLRERYRSLDALNREWETHFTRWEDVEPFTTYEMKARKGENYAPWADHREFMDITMARTLGRLREFVREVDPHAPVGVEGTQMPSAWGGFDLWRLSQALDWVEPYDICGARAIFRSFLPAGAPVLGTVFGDDYARIRHRLWRLLLEGDRGVLVWDDEKSRMIAKDNAAMPVTARGRELAKVLGEIRAAAPRVFKMRRLDDGIAIHYSQASVRAHWMFDSRVDGATWPRRFNSYEPVHSHFARVRDSFMRVVEDLGLDYRFVSYEQMEKGGLRGYKVLLLPQSVAMSAEEVKRVREFVEAGGTVIADNMTATMDEHCRRLERGQLDDLFGIVRRSVEWREPRAGELPAFEADITVAGGTPRRVVGLGAPTVIVRKVGRGRAVYLNAGMHDYGKLRLRLQGQATRDLFEGLLREAGVAAKLRVLDARDGKPVPCVRVWRFAGADGQWFAIMRNPEYRVSELGQVGYPDNAAIEVPVKVRLGNKVVDLDPTRPVFHR